MVTTATTIARGLGFLLPMLALPACFDVQQIDEGDGYFVIDDLEDGDLLPKTSLFNRWQCFTYNPDVGQDPDQSVSCDLETPGAESAYGLFARFKLHDGTLAGTQYAGAALQTFVNFAVVDLTGYRTLVFDMKVVFDDPPPQDTSFNVQLGCNSVKSKNDAAPDQLYFNLWHSVLATKEWQPFRFPLADFVQPDWEKNRFADGSASCLALIDSIHFEVTEPLTYGQSGSGVIHIDRVQLE